MTPTPVGMRCPECSRQRTKVRSVPTARTQGPPSVTVGIIIVCVLAFLATGRFGFSGDGNRLFVDLALWGDAVDRGHDYWRLITGGFLHAGFLHIAFNMYLLWVLGQMLEPVLGWARFAALYVTALLWGSFGALLLTKPDVLTVGASGAVFGLMGAAAVELRARGINPFKTDIGVLILFNLALSFVLSGISVGGHIGGLVGGALVGVAYNLADQRRLRWLGFAACLGLAAIAVAGAILAAGARAG